MKTLSIIFDGFEELELSGPVTLLARAGIQTDIYSINNTVVGKHGLALTNIKSLSELNYKEYDALFLPGGPHYSKLESNELVIEIIKYFYTNKKTIATICAAPTILGHLGFLKNRKYTCFKPMNENFGGTYYDAYAVEDDFILTGISAAASIDLGLLLIKQLLGKEIEEKIKRSIFY